MFSCDCGSVMLFDELGAPWPQHDCETSWTRRLARETAEDGTLVVHLDSGITVQRRPVGAQPVGQVTLHLEYGDAIESYTAFVPTTLLTPHIRRGATVAVHLVGVQVMSAKPVWYCSELEVIGVGR